MAEDVELSNLFSPDVPDQRIAEKYAYEYRVLLDDGRQHIVFGDYEFDEPGVALTSAQDVQDSIGGVIQRRRVGEWERVR